MATNEGPFGLVDVGTIVWQVMEVEGIPLNDDFEKMTAAAEAQRAHTLRDTVNRIHCMINWNAEYIQGDDLVLLTLASNLQEDMRELGIELEITHDALN